MILTQPAARAAIACYLPDTVRKQVVAETLAVARHFYYHPGVARVLATLAPYLTPKQLHEALNIARAIVPGEIRARALAELVLYRPRLLRREIGVEIIAALERIDDERFTSEVWAEVVPHLARDLLPSALRVVRNIDSEEYRSLTLCTLVPYLPYDLMPEALGIAREIRSEAYRSQVITALLPYLPQAFREEALDEALTTARQIIPASSRSKALASLASHLSPDVRLQVLREALETDTIDGLEDLAPYLPEEMFTEVFELVPFLPGRYHSGIVKAFAPRYSSWAEHHRSTAYAGWPPLLHGVAKGRRREELLPYLATLGPVIAQLGGVQAVAETACAILDVGRWWP